VGRLLTETTQAGDVVLFAEVSRMARSTLQVLEMLACCMQRGVHVHIAKQQMVLDGSLPSRITATVLGLAAEIEREFIALRTREALAKRRADGKPPWDAPKGNLRRGSNSTPRRPSSAATWPRALTSWRLPNCSSVRRRPSMRG
jgi:DNA invertase Pin-like site-specific DNA recombinase